MSDATYQPNIYTQQGGSAQFYKSGASATFESGATLTLNSGATLGITGNISGSTSGQLLNSLMSGSTDLTNFGHSVVTASTGAGAKQYVLAAPVAGCHKIVTATGVNSSDTLTLYTGSTAVVVLGGQGSTTANLVKFILPTTVQLVGLSATQWGLVNCSTLYAYTTS